LDLHKDDTHDIDSMNCNSFSGTTANYENCKQNTSDTAPLFPICKCEIYILNCKLFGYLKKGVKCLCVYFKLQSFKGNDDEMEKMKEDGLNGKFEVSFPHSFILICD